MLQLDYLVRSVVVALKVTVNTCTCTDVFTVITTKDQSGGIYNSYSTGDQGFMAVVNKPCPRAIPSDSVNPWHCAIAHDSAVRIEITLSAVAENG